MSRLTPVTAPASPPALVGALAIVLALLSAALVSFDADLSRMLPDRIWRALHIEDIPLKLSLTMPPLLIALWWARRFVQDWPLHHVAIALIFVGAQTGGIKLGPIDLLDIATISALLAGVAIRLKDTAATLKITSLLFFAAGLFGLNFLTLIHQHPVQHLVGAIGFFKVAILAAILLHLINDEKSISFAVRALITVALLSSLSALFQSMLYYAFGIDLTFIDHFGGADTHFKPTPFGLLPRASAFNSTAQHLSSFLLIALPFALFERSNRSRLMWKFFKVNILLGGILATWNFGAIFAALFVIGLYPYVRWPRHIIQIGMGMLLFIALLYFSGGLEWLYAHSFGDVGVGKGVSQRHTLMYLGLESLLRFPLIGEGLRGFTDASGNFWHRPVHNAYLQAATEIGLLGALVFGALLLTKLTQLAILARGVDNEAYAIRAGFLALLGLGFLMFSEPMFDHSNTWLLLGLAEALIVWRASHKPDY